MHTSANTAATRLATRLGFFCAGFAMAAWAPLVPFAKANVGADDALLGLLLLCLGIGSIVAMPATGYVCARIGSRPMIIAGTLGLVVSLPLLTLAASPALLGAALFVFGASLGALDVAINVHAVEVEKASTRPMMSGFHALFSIGGFAGAGGVTLLLSAGAGPFAGALAVSLLTLAAIAVAWPRLIAARATDAPGFAMPHGSVLLLGLLAAATFLVEGAMLDWSALLIVGENMVEAARGGLGYVLFSIAMTAGRLTGDRIVAAVGNRRVILWGGALAVAGLALLLAAPPPLALGGFVLIGLGCSNIVPVLFSLAGRQDAMPVGLAVAAVTTAGYAGILLGPAGIGFIAHVSDLATAFWLLAALMAVVAALSGRATRG